MKQVSLMFSGTQASRYNCLLDIFDRGHRQFLAFFTFGSRKANQRLNLALFLTRESPLSIMSMTVHDVATQGQSYLFLCAFGAGDRTWNGSMSHTIINVSGMKVRIRAHEAT